MQTTAGKRSVPPLLDKTKLALLTIMLDKLLQKYPLVLLLLATASLGVCGWLFAGFTVDDSYISHRYAHNLVHYGVWNWNPTGARVEAYTSALYAVLALLPEGLDLPVALFFKAFHLLLFLGLLWLLWRKTERKNFLIGLLFLSTGFYLHLHLFSGIETFGFMLALGALLYGMLFPERQHRSYFWLLVFLLPFVRPEGLLFALVAAFYRIGVFQDRSFGFPLAILLLWGLYFWWRYDYFGYFFPNTFYFKSLMGSSVRNLPKNLLDIAFHGFPLLLLLWHFRSRVVWFYSGTALLVALLVYAPSDLQMNYADRFWIQLFWPIWFIHLFLANHAESRRWIVLSGLILLLGTNRDLNEWRRLSHYGNELEKVHVEIGKALYPFRDKGYTLLTGDAGALPYFSGWQSTEFIGVANPQLTHEGWQPDYLQDLKPDLVVLYSRTAHPTGILPVFHQPEIYDWAKETHELVGVKAWRNGDYYLYFLRKGLPDFKLIQRALAEK